MQKEFDVTYGEDYVLLGFRPGNEAVVKGIVSDLRKLYTIDARGNKVTDIPMMEGINRFEDFDFYFQDLLDTQVVLNGFSMQWIPRIFP